MQQCARREHVTSRKVPTQLTAGMFPSAQRIRRRWNSSRQAERVQQTVVWQRFNKTLIALQLIEEYARPQPYLRQGTRLTLCVNRFVHRPARGISKYASKRTEATARKHSGRPRGCRRSRNPLPAIPTMYCFHDCPPAEFSFSTLARPPCASARPNSDSVSCLHARQTRTARNSPPPGAQICV